VGDVANVSSGALVGGRLWITNVRTVWQPSTPGEPGLSLPHVQLESVRTERAQGFGPVVVLFGRRAAARAVLVCAGGSAGARAVCTAIRAAMAAFADAPVFGVQFEGMDKLYEHQPRLTDMLAKSKVAWIPVVDTPYNADGLDGGSAGGASRQDTASDDAALEVDAAVVRFSERFLLDYGSGDAGDADPGVEKPYKGEQAGKEFLEVEVDADLGLARQARAVHGGGRGNGMGLVQLWRMA
ncbi:hypothetical protein HK405_012843, partial [Cladochytrium tenue]